MTTEAPTYKRTAANTRRVTNELREMQHYLQGRTYFHAPTIESVDTWWDARRYNSTGTFALEHNAPMRAGCPIVIYPGTGEAWIRPASRGDGSVQVVDKALREMAAETRYLDVLLNILHRDGWTLMPGSETLDSLLEWRGSRRGQL